VVAASGDVAADELPAAEAEAELDATLDGALRDAEHGETGDQQSARDRDPEY
jgi:hypothetical protein